MLWCAALAVALSFMGTALGAPSLLPGKKPQQGITLALAGRLLDGWDAPARKLSEEDGARYAGIFLLQEDGDFEQADAEIAQLEDRALMGHVLYQRYLARGYKAKYEELADWMKNYADHPGAQKIHSLAEKRKPAGAARLIPPKAVSGISGYQDFDIGPLAQPYLSGQKQGARGKEIIRAIHASLSGNPSAGLRRLESEEAARIFNKTTYDALRAEIAESYFYNGKIEDAYRNAAASSDRSPEDLPLAGWIAGLSAWKLGNYGDAARYFERAAESRRSSAWMVAAGAHWAARAHLRNHKPREVSRWLSKAAEYPRTFYGIISLKALGLDQTRFNWELPRLSARHMKALTALPAGSRALALIDAGRPEWAGQELRQINPGNDVLLQEAMIVLAQKAGIPSLSMRMGSSFKDEFGEPYDAALYPDVPWEPKDGFDVDKALVYAFIRQESKFDAAASNKSSGAIGLMQLMPGTAKHVAKAEGKKVDLKTLTDPTVNISLGQKYLAQLLQNEVVGNNLFKLAVAYNAGPGKLARWEKQVSYADDPLLFIESIPVGETRMFVERVLTNYWIYRLKYDQDTESLDDVAAGDWPVYVAQDIRRGSRFADAGNYLTR